MITNVRANTSTVRNSLGLFRAERLDVAAELHPRAHIALRLLEVRVLVRRADLRAVCREQMEPLRTTKDAHVNHTAQTGTCIQPYLYAKHSQRNHTAASSNSPNTNAPHASHSSARRAPPSTSTYNVVVHAGTRRANPDGKLQPVSET